MVVVVVDEDMVAEEDEVAEAMAVVHPTEVTKAEATMAGNRLFRSSKSYKYLLNSFLQYHVVILCKTGSCTTTSNPFIDKCPPGSASFRSARKSESVAFLLCNTRFLLETCYFG